MTAFANISPAFEVGDIIAYQSPLKTTRNRDVTLTFDETGALSGFTGEFSSDPQERFLIKIQRVATGDWHPQSGVDGMWVYVLTGAVAPFASASRQAEAGSRRRPMYAEVDGRVIPVNTAQEAANVIKMAPRKVKEAPPPPPKPKMQYKILK